MIRRPAFLCADFRCFQGRVRVDAAVVGDLFAGHLEKQSISRWGAYAEGRLAGAAYTSRYHCQLALYCVSSLLQLSISQTSVSRFANCMSDHAFWPPNACALSENHFSLSPSSSAPSILTAPSWAVLPLLLFASRLLLNPAFHTARNNSRMKSGVRKPLHLTQTRPRDSTPWPKSGTSYRHKWLSMSLPARTLGEPRLSMSNHSSSARASSWSCRPDSPCPRTCSRGTATPSLASTCGSSATTSGAWRLSTSRPSLTLSPKLGFALQNSHLLLSPSTFFAAHKTRSNPLFSRRMLAAFKSSSTTHRLRWCFIPPSSTGTPTSPARSYTARAISSRSTPPTSATRVSRPAASMLALPLRT
ncbi:hypothetical protein B5807_06243 [Epicoccum nigrum]|uniref:Uncharacterized protein n=1 Tax=Epicoccum nigrum TaxID=105696 RepID=A0A1Y2M087_EPING|nr:hypothetical protein B5807_06243 [Epicoccum nigrum]